MKLKQEKLIKWKKNGLINKLFWLKEQLRNKNCKVNWLRCKLNKLFWNKRNKD